MKKFKSRVLPLCVLILLSSSCSKSVNKNNKVTSGPEVNQMIGDRDHEIQVISNSVLQKAFVRSSLLPLQDKRAMQLLNSLPQGEAAEVTPNPNVLQSNNQSLLIGFPIGLVGEQNVFGGVITKVSDQENETLGSLKLTELHPIHVRTLISGVSSGTPALTLFGCISACDENSQQYGVINLPIVGVNEENKMLILDLASLGKELDLISMLDPEGEYTQLKAISSETTAVEYDIQTLLFDIKTIMVPLTPNPEDPEMKTTEFTVRWYLKLGSGFNPAYTSRSPTEGVGFFTTDRSADPKITRFSTSDNGTGAPSVKYYIKNVPEEFRAAFASAIDCWNNEFKDIIGKDLIRYEFIDDTEDFVTGDIRYNIIEWDLINKAGYGGLGPSIANEYTGEIVSANVLIQGPSIIKLYSDWFKVSEEARELIAQGDTGLAQMKVRDFHLSATRKMKERTKRNFRLKLGKFLEMKIPAQDARLEDPLHKEHFEIIPEGITYKEYMDGYMREVLAHELGHNLGLRHNFKGNLGASEKIVSRSIMEYLGRPFRHLNIIGAYDRMAIRYGYNGEAPKNLDWFCTDEDQVSDLSSLSKMSPECTKSDATKDPYSYWEDRFQRIIDLALAVGSTASPVWTIKELVPQINETILGLSAYALSAEATFSTWTNFSEKEDRPVNKSEVKSYVLKSFQQRICNPKLIEEIKGKESVEAQELALGNLGKIFAYTAAITKTIGLFTPDELSCQ